MNERNVRLIQLGLNKHYKNHLIVDGNAGKNTFAAINKVSLIPLHWNPKRKLIGFLQVFSLLDGFDPGPLDGFAGPQTNHAVDQLQFLIKNGERESDWRNEDPITSKLSAAIPLQNYKDLVKCYGEVGTNQTKIELPHAVRLAWDTDTKINRFTCHEKVADSLLRALNKVIEHYGPEQYVSFGMDLFAGCLNVRKIRGGTKYSTHSWGISCDWNSANNRLRWDDKRAVFAQPKYNRWNEIWEEEQWVSLGREMNFDWQHYQMARVK